MRRNDLNAAPREGQVGYQEEFLHWSNAETLGWAAKGGDGVTIPGEFKK